ncbi:dihydroneopterin aldolase [Candidatus Riesia pediculicola]|uniref:dihydroneopterin aldolase n=1 Tax=Candidatus Riesia pediculicola TaxID=401619 RepID=UPI0009E1EB68|nr:dihydroneopterin aldolase [Candidatus Riesia pediculicola]
MKVLIIDQLSIFTRIGVYDWEKQIKQKLLISIKISRKKHDIENKKFENYLDYSKISETIVNYLERNSFSLIEEVADKISGILFNQFFCNWVKVTVFKPNAIARAKTVGVCLERKIDI